MGKKNKKPQYDNRLIYIIRYYENLFCREELQNLCSWACGEKIMDDIQYYELGKIIRERQQLLGITI